MGWIQDVFKPLLEQIKLDIKSRDTIFRKAVTITVPTDQDPVEDYEDIMIHGNSFLIEKKANEQSGFYILDPNNLDLPIGMLSAGVDAGPSATVHTLISMASNATEGTSGEGTDFSTGVLVKKKNVDGGTAGFVVAVTDDALEKLDNDTPLFEILNGLENNEKVLSISSDSIYFHKAGDNAEFTVPGSYLALWTPDGLLITGDRLEDLQTSDKTIVGAINEILNGGGSGPNTNEDNIVPFGGLQIFQAQNSDPNVTDIQVGDIASLWLDDAHWIQGMWLGTEDTNISNENNWEIFNEYYIEPEDNTGGPITGGIGSGQIGTDPIG